MSNDTNENSICISNWECEVSGNVPQGFSFPSPTVTLATEGSDFEIATATLSFRGNAPSGQNAFSATFSFTIPFCGNLVDINVSSDDNASITAKGKTATSTLHKAGRTMSDWTLTPSGEVDVHGTFETIGGPYGLTATIKIVRSLSGKVYGVNFIMSSGKPEINGPYEVTKYKISCSGNAPYGCFAFNAQEDFVIPQCENWVDVEIQSDDNARIVLGELLVAQSTLNKKGTAKTSRIEAPPEMIPVQVSLENLGGPYSLDATISLKRSVRRLVMIGARATPKEKQQEKRDIWRRVGLGETVHVYVENTDGDVISDGTSIFIGGDLKIDSFQFDALTTGNTLVRAVCTDGDVLENAFEVIAPETFEIKEVSNVLQTERTDHGIFRANRMEFEIQVLPLDVSFSSIYVWELTGDSVRDGIANNDDYISITTHKPSEPVSLSDDNALLDTVGATPEHGEILPITEDKWQGLPLHTSIGKFIWTIPVKWHLFAPDITKKETGTLFSNVLVHTTVFRVSSENSDEIPTGVDSITRKVKI